MILIKQESSNDLLLIFVYAICFLVSGATLSSAITNLLLKKSKAASIGKLSRLVQSVKSIP